MNPGRRSALASLALAFVAAVASAATNDWENPHVNSIGRLPARTYSVPLADVAAALADALEPESPWRISLNGRWKISWAGNPDLRVKDFWKHDYDDARWHEIDVPSCVEMRGFGSPGYTNANYPFKREMPVIRNRDTGAADYNPVSSYRRRFAVPESWKGRRVILRFDGVYSAYYVWVNGKKVGYAEDSCLPSEFDITECLAKSGENVLAVEVYRWSDGSYLEDQDMFRYSGIFRDVTLWSMPKDGIWDFRVNVKCKVENGKCEEASLSVDGIDGDWSATLYDADKKTVATLSSLSNVSNLSNAHLWSAEDPYLYTLVVRKGEDIRMRRVGFREIRRDGRRVLVNGRPVKFKGVNRHEANPDNGRTVSTDDMLRDVTLMKRYNIDTVRTSHYPDHRLWYDICDRYGLYVIAEANVEANEMPLYRDTPEGLGSLADWKDAVVERNVRQVGFYGNHPSIVMWSMGNESGHGPNFRAAIAEVRRLDPTRLIHWERGNVDADVDSMMYPSVDQVVYRGKWGCGLVKDPFRNGDCPSTSNDAGKPFFVCEYAHAMGNALGNFQEYWDAFYSYDCLVGGCVWDWIDQSVWRCTDKVDPKTGRRERYLAYGGDFDEEPHDGPFCNNGLIGPTREVTPKLVEAGHVHRNLVLRGFELENRFLFTPADAFDGFWEVLEDGLPVASSTFAPPSVAPLSKGRLDGLEKTVGAVPRRPGHEYFLTVEFRLKADAAWAKKGWPVSRNQVFLGGAWTSVPSAVGKPTVVEKPETVEVSCGGTRAVFSRATGTLSELTMNGRTILRDPAEGVVAGPRFTCARAFTDNDRWLRDGQQFYEDRTAHGFYAEGLSQLRYHAFPIVVEGGTIRTEVEVTGSKSAGFLHTAAWTFGADGSVNVASRIVPHGSMPQALPRIGLSLKLDKSLERMVWYGRGPFENYVDRCTGSFLGVWRSTVTGQYVDYVRPQDCGYKADVRWVVFQSEDGRGVRFTSTEPMFVQALHYDCEDLDFARHRAGQKRHRTPLAPVEEIRLNLDCRQLGIGGGSCGPLTLPRYRFDVKETAWQLRMEPVTNAPAVDAADRLNEGWWRDRHEQKLREVLSLGGRADIGLVGDSITHFWETTGKDVACELAKEGRIVNLAYWGDRVEHVIWRIEHGELDGYQARCIMLMIGTNNTEHDGKTDPPEHIAAGVCRILDLIASRQPGAKVILLPIFPRGASAADSHRRNNEAANALLCALADGTSVRWLDFNARFVDASGDVKALMPDRLHPNADGYRIWLEAVRSEIRRCLGTY